MNLIDRLERRLGWMAFPGLLRYYAILTGMVFVLVTFRPELQPLLEFDLLAILSGEVWRVVTFLFTAAHVSNAYPLMVQILLMFIVIRISFLISDALESAWGVFRTSMFLYVGILGLLLGNVLFLGLLWGTGVYIFASAFFAFATLYPRVEFLLMFVLPVQVRFFAIIGAVLIFARMADLFIGGVVIAPVFYMLVFINYFLWAGLPALKGRRTLIKAAKRRRKFETAKQPAGEAFHECVICTRTDQSHPGLEFRISADGKEYCLDHLPEAQDEKKGETA